MKLFIVFAEGKKANRMHERTHVLNVNTTSSSSKYDLTRHESSGSSVVRAFDRCTKGHRFDFGRVLWINFNV